MADGFAMIVASCCNCGRVGVFNPSKAPSIRLNKEGKPDPSGDRQPLCRDCFDRWNQIHRIDKGLQPVPLNPDAYGPCMESEL